MDLVDFSENTLDELYEYFGVNQSSTVRRHQNCLITSLVAKFEFTHLHFEFILHYTRVLQVENSHNFDYAMF